MRVLLLGHPRPLEALRWKDDLAEAGEELGWQVTHWPARGVDADDVVREAKESDLFLWARTHGHFPDGDVEAMLRRIEDAGVPTVGIHLDLYWGIGRREAEIGKHPWWTCQHIWTADGGPRPWASRGVNHRWMPPPMGSRFFGLAEPSPRLRHRVVFVGRCVRDIHGEHRANLLAWARRRFGAGFRQYGRFGRNTAYGSELSTVYASAQLAVGDSARAPAYWSDRVPTSLGRGALLAHPYVEGMAEVGFTSDTMIHYRWGRYDDITRRFDAMSHADRTAMREAALTVIAERHMWRHRLLDVQRAVYG